MEELKFFLDGYLPETISTILIVACYILIMVVKMKVTKSGTTLKTIVESKTKEVSDEYKILSKTTKEVQGKVFSNDDALKEITALLYKNLDALQLISAQNVVNATAQKIIFENIITNPQSLATMRRMLNLTIGQEKSAQEMYETIRRLEKAALSKKEEQPKIAKVASEEEVLENGSKQLQ